MECTNSLHICPKSQLDLYRLLSRVNTTFMHSRDRDRLITYRDNLMSLIEEKVSG